jgi:hypothetical protein
MRPRAILSVIVGLAVPALGAGGCTASDGGAKSITEVVGFTTRVPPPKPFVQESRPEELPYLPIGVSATRDAPRKTPAQFKEIESSLDAQRGSNEAAGAQARVLGSTPPPAPPALPR